MDPRLPHTAPPAPGDPVRMGSYNVQLSLSGDRARAVAQNITQHAPDVVALQEADVATGQAVTSALGRSWSRAANDDRGVAQQIVYRNSKYRSLDQGRSRSTVAASPS